MSRALILLVVASACSRETEHEPKQTRAMPPAPPAVAPPVPPPAPPAAPAATLATEIGMAAEKTSRGGQVLAIGRPRFRLVPASFDELVVRVGTRRVLAQDRAEVKQWDLSNGVLLDRQLLSSDPSPQIALVASADGAWIATGEFATMRFNQGSKRVPSKLAAHVRSFIASTQVIAEDKDGVMLLEPATGNLIERLPKEPFPVGSSPLALAGDREQVWLISQAGYARWSRDAATFVVVTPAAKKWTEAAIALRAPIGVVQQDGVLHRLDLATGAMKKLAPRATVFAVSPTGAWTAFGGVNRVRVVETKTGREVASVAVKGAVERIAFAEDDNVLAYEENGTIRITDVANGAITPRPTPTSSRFRGWAGNGIASIDHEGATQQLDVRTRAIGPAREAVQPPAASPLTIALTDHAIVARTTGRQVARLEVGEPPRPGPGLEQTYWKAVGSPTGKQIAAWVRRPDVMPEDKDDSETPKCDHDPRGECVLEYIAELWSINGAASMVWRARPDGKRRPLLRGWPYPKTASGPISFTPDGTHVLFGFADGDVIVRATDASATSRVESLHRAPITRIEVAPGGQWVFTEDAEGEQRIWPL